MKNRFTQGIVFAAGLLLLSVSAEAACVGSNFAGGAGTDASPWQIATAQQLSNIRECLGSSHADKRFVMTADISLGGATWASGDGWSPIGSSVSTERFFGRFDGGGYAIWGLTISRPTTEFVGLFGYVDGGQIRNLKIASSSISALASAGIAAGYITNGAQILNVSVQGSVSTSEKPSGYSDAGGLIGDIYGAASAVENCSAVVTVTGTGRNIGGLIGYQAAGSVESSFSIGSVRNTDGGRGQIGGLVGRSASGSVKNSWSQASVQTDLQGTDTGAAGFIGSVGTVTLENNFSLGNVTTTGGTTAGFVALATAATATGNFWNTETSGQATSVVGTGKTTSELKTAGTFAGWDFSTRWTMSGLNEGYPQLTWAHLTAVEPPAAQPTGKAISSLAHLLWISEDTSRWADTYRVTADINMSATSAWNLGKGWKPLGTLATPFTGDWHGGGHQLKGLYINRPGVDYVGLLGLAVATEITNVNLHYPTVAGQDYVGTLAGSINTDSNSAASVVTGAIATGVRVTSVTANLGTATGGLVAQAFNTSLSDIQVSGQVTGLQRVAGAVGSLRFASSLTDAIVDIKVSSNAGNSRFNGGLVGVMEGSTGTPTVRRAVVRGSVDMSASSTNDNGDVGGAVGYILNDSLIRDVYADVAVTGPAATSNAARGVGGFVGRAVNTARIENSYSFGTLTASAGAVGAFIGSNTSTSPVVESYWDVTTSGRGSDGQTTGSAGGTGKSSANLAVPGNFLTAGWDFAGETRNGSTQAWGYNSGVNSGRPFLIIEGFTNQDSAYRFTVEFRNHDASLLSSQSIYWGEDAVPPTVTRTGYSFTGWSGSSTNVTSARTLTAQFTINSYTLSFNVDGGSAVSAITQNYGTAVTAPANPTRAGYTFVGWDPVVPSTVPAANVTHRAMWLKDGSEVSCPYGSCTPTVSAGGTASYTINVTGAGDADLSLTVSRPNEAQWPVTVVQTRTRSSDTSRSELTIALSTSTIEIQADGDGHPTLVSTATVAGKNLVTELSKAGLLSHKVTGSKNSVVKSALAGKRAELDNQGRFHLSVLLDASQDAANPAAGAYRTYLYSQPDGTSTSGFERYSGSAWAVHSPTLGTNVSYPEGHTAELFQRSSKTGIKVETPIETELRW